MSAVVSSKARVPCTERQAGSELLPPLVSTLGLEAERQRPGSQGLKATVWILAKTGREQHPPRARFGGGVGFPSNWDTSKYLEEGEKDT